MRRSFSPILPFLLLLLSHELHAQSAGVEDLTIGMSSDSALAMFRGGYTTIDTVTTGYRAERLSIRLAPVQLAGLDGLLVMNVDNRRRVIGFGWSRQAASGYMREGVWEKFSGWKSWEVPTGAETEKVAQRLNVVLGEIMDYSGIRPIGAPDEDSASTMGGFWTKKGMQLTMMHDGTMLAIRAQPWSSDMVEMTE